MSAVRPRFVDAHCHLHEYSDEEAERLAGEYVIVAVSDDAESSLRTVELSSRLPVLPCVGIHPWEAAEASEEDVRTVEELVGSGKVACIGEVGLDKKFVPQTFDKQLEVFERMVELAVEYSLPMNLHAAGAWREVFDAVTRAGVDRALFHWYSGPLDLLREIVEEGYMISINPSVRFQRKHRRALEEAPLESLLTESDGPYRYRGLELGPRMVPEVVAAIAEVKNVDPEEVARVVEANLSRFLRR